MKLKNSIIKQTCGKEAFFRQMLPGNRRRLIQANAIECMEQVLAGTTTFRAYFQEQYASLFLEPLLREQAVSRDAAIWERFATWLQEQGRIERFAPYIHTKQGGIRLAAIYQKENGAWFGVVTVFKKNEISDRGRSPFTRTDSSALLAYCKLALEQQYPGITMQMVGLRSKDDRGVNLVEQLQHKDIASCAFEQQVADGTMEAYADTLFAALTDKEVLCKECFYHAVCSGRTSDWMPPADKESPLDVEKSYTPEQKEVIAFQEGLCVVAAGPGSGKTAVLIARVKRLVQDGVLPASICMVTFTKAAAEEMKQRLAAAGVTGVVVATLNSIGYEIIKSASKEHFQVASKRVRYPLLKHLLLSRQVIAGCSYEELYAPYGLVTKLDGLIQCLESGREDAFLRQCDSLEPELVREIYTAYTELLRCKHILSYSEQVSRAITILEENAIARRFWQNRFQYLLVDEYQDVDEQQHLLCELLSAVHGNLMVVGDDDQAIYSFRKGDNRYMQALAGRKDATVLYLQTNFRSTQQIVAWNEELIRHNVERLDKSFHAVKAGEHTPLVIQHFQMRQLDALLQKLRDRGYAYHDIAVIARTNATLEKLQGQLTVSPGKLAKDYIIEDAAFWAVYDALALQVYGMAAPESAASLFRICLGAGLDLYTVWNRLGDIPVQGMYEMLRFLATSDDVMAPVAKRVLSMPQEGCALDVLPKQHPVRLHLEEAFDEDVADTALEQLHCLQGMLDCDDDSRVRYEATGQVTFITAHDAKGLEFPVVIIYDAFSFGRQQATEEDLRTFYVATTRAERELYIALPSLEPNPIVDAVTDLITTGKAGEVQW